MIKKTFMVTGLLAQFALIPSAFAISCNHPINAYDQTYCSGLKMIQLDKEINDQYGKTLKALNAEQKKQIKHTQIQWIRQRDAECSNNGTIDVTCVNEKMESRVTLLKSIERECQNSGCDKSLLSKVE